ncbi:arylmalonate decarboxylase [Novosphingobium sp. BL-52-GroH]|uniref:maleate cis-trans isomerase family protein n=1 Tax=Novosphingobium sp. BL-52-GroH TaxID=3349877 RepID=UPI00384BDD41
MTDVLGWRKVFAVLGPSTNTIVQPDMEALRPAGVTNAYRDIYVENVQALSDESFMAGTQKISDGVADALRTAMTCSPDYLVLGISAISFVGGKAGCQRFVDDVQAMTGLGISVGSQALVAALEAYGGIRKVAFVSPYYPAANANVSGFLADYGFETVRDIPLRRSSWTDIAQTPEDLLRRTLRELDGDDVDAICQVGTNMSMMRLAGEAEQWLGKPVIAINAATYWHALRTNGITDRIEGYGRLFTEY